MEAGDGETDESQLEHKEMIRLKKEIGDTEPHLWRTCFHRRLRSKVSYLRMLLSTSRLTRFP